ncbi:MAG: homoserine dehydrogenase, partial [Deltaproteobacteria bacterium]|nr:homoserine dehydrogenase [Deltaproteobacteria bacterium]
VHDPEVEVVVELIGGIEPARSLILEAIRRGKDVVTANKALLALHGGEIFAAAEARGVSVGFEASVAGGIPIIRTLREGLAADRNRALFGIVNGTCNYILTTMSEEGEEFDTVLRHAQEQGLAEADPSFDIDGIDAAHKLTLLAMLAFGVQVPFDAVYVEGIRHLSQTDILFAREFGYVIKLLAIAKDEDGAIDVRVHPTMVPRRSLLADVGGAYNAIFVQGEALGSSLYFGRGAGVCRPRPQCWLT